MNTSPTTQSDVIGQFLNEDGGEPTRPEWNALRQAVDVLIVNMQQMAPTGDLAFFAVEEALRKLRYAPTDPASPYAAKLARCGQALRRHQTRLKHADRALLRRAAS